MKKTPEKRRCLRRSYEWRRQVPPKRR